MSFVYAVLCNDISSLNIINRLHNLNKFILTSMTYLVL